MNGLERYNALQEELRSVTQRLEECRADLKARCLDNEFSEWKVEHELPHVISWHWEAVPSKWGGKDYKYKGTIQAADGTAISVKPSGEYDFALITKDFRAVRSELHPPKQYKSRIKRERELVNEVQEEAYRAVQASDTFKAKKRAIEEDLDAFLKAHY